MLNVMLALRRLALFGVAFAVTGAHCVWAQSGHGSTQGRTSTSETVAAPVAPSSGTATGTVVTVPPPRTTGIQPRLPGTPGRFPGGGARFPILWSSYFFYGWGEYVPLAAYPAPTPITDPNAPTGGLQLDVEPRSARVYVDGAYAGTVEEFSGYYKHLTLSAGPHRIDILASGYDPLTIDLAVIPGQTRSYRASLNRAFGGR